MAERLAVTPARTLARVARGALALLAIGVVVWSFAEVGRRALARRAAARERPITLTIMHWGDPAEDKICATLAADYEATHPNVRINRINAGGEFDAKLKTMMAAGTPPDLFYLKTDVLADFATLKLIRPVDDYVAQDRKSAEGNAYFEDIYPQLLKSFSYDVGQQKAGEGSLYGLPKDSTTLVMFVNLDLFAKAGVQVPYEGWTWEEYAAACRKITDLSGTPGLEGRKIFGGNFEFWPATVRNVIWTFGGDFFNGNDFKHPVLSAPPAQEALKFVQRLRLDEKTVFNATGVDKDGGQEFFTGNIGINGPVGRWKVPRYKEITAFKWDVVPIPHKVGVPSYSQLFTTAWTMSTKTPHPDEAFQLMKYLCGPRGGKLQSELGLAIPPTKSMANSPAFLSPPGLPPHHAELFLKALDQVKFDYSPREPEWARIVDDQIKASIQAGKDTLANAKEIEASWLAELASPLRQREWGPFPWGTVLMALGAVVVATAAALTVKARTERLGAIDRRQERAGFMFILPWLIGFLLLALGPMLFSLMLSLSQWDAMIPIPDAKWVGLANFKQITTADPTFYQSIKVTLYFVVLSVPISQLAALGVALLMNNNVRGIAVFRTIYFVPSVVSGAALAVLWLQIFNNDYGLLNTVLRPVAHFLGTVPPNWFGTDLTHKPPVNDAIRWAVPAFVIMGLWGVGGGMIIYLAGLKGIPTSLYEAATIDGAGPLRRFWNVTLPMLSPLLFYNLVMGIIGSFQVFTQAYIMTGAGPENATLFYVLQLFRQAFEFHNMGYASALAWILFVLCLVLTLAVFRGSKRLVYYEGLK